MRNISILLILIALTFPACGKDNIQPSEDSLIATEAFRKIDILEKAYEERDREILRDRIIPRIARTITKDLYFDNAELELRPRMVKIRENEIIVNINWEGVWEFPDDTRLENRGAADLILDRETMRVLEIRGDMPFAIPSLESR